MDRSQILTLVSRTYEPDDIGQQVPTEDRRDVYVNIGSVSAAEWYEGGAHGLAPEYKCTMSALDYAGEQIAELEGRRYRIYRTYRGKNDILELYLERRAGI